VKKKGEKREMQKLYSYGMMLLDFFDPTIVHGLTPIFIVARRMVDVVDLL
jgi:predicted GH43/DUF377 family glycosyl hydrolase